MLKLRKERNYTYEDVVDIHPSKMPDYEKKVKLEWFNIFSNQFVKEA